MKTAECEAVGVKQVEHSAVEHVEDQDGCEAVDQVEYEVAD